MDTHEQFLKEEMTVMKGETYKKEQLKNSLEPKH